MSDVLAEVLETFGAVLDQFAEADREMILTALRARYSTVRTGAMRAALVELTGAPLTEHSILAWARAHRRDWSNLAGLLLAGAPLDEPLSRNLEKFVRVFARQIEYVPQR